MKIDDYMALWAEDGRIDPEQLDVMAATIPQLHAKWHRFYTSERLIFKQREAEAKRLKLLRWEWYLGKLDDVARQELGWPVQPLKVARQDLDTYLDADAVLAKARAAVDLSTEKCRFLEDIIKNQINYRNNQLTTILGFLKFKNGV